jgi:hypothetical protein
MKRLLTNELKKRNEESFKNNRLLNLVTRKILNRKSTTKSSLSHGHMIGNRSFSLSARMDPSFCHLS